MSRPCKTSQRQASNLVEFWCGAETRALRRFCSVLLFWLLATRVALGDGSPISKEAILRCLAHPPALKELAFKFESQRNEPIGFNHNELVPFDRYGILRYCDDGRFFEQLTGNVEEFSNHFVYPGTEMYAQTGYGYWAFCPAMLRDSSLREGLDEGRAGTKNNLRLDIEGVSNVVAFDGAPAFYALCYGVPRLRDVTVNAADGTFSGTPWTILFGSTIRGQVHLSKDGGSAEIDYTNANFTNSHFSARCVFADPALRELALPSDITVEWIKPDGARETRSKIQIEHAWPGTPDPATFAATAHYLKGMDNHQVYGKDDYKRLPIQLDPAVEAAYQALIKGTPASELLATAQAKARAEGKAVFVHFGASWCGWCKILNAYLERPAVRPVFDKYFVVQEVLMGETMANKSKENPGALELYTKLGAKAGLPAYAFVDSAGLLIANSQMPNGDPIGFPGEPQEVDCFLKQVRQAAPGISAEELAVLKAELAKSKQ